jgi:tRNA-specific 2-thiouridylase
MNTLSEQLGIPIHIIDLSESFNRSVVEYFIKSYQSGRTPNPCLVCNPTIKFGALLDYAMSLGTDFLATGHYARITQDEQNRPHLRKGADPVKDQSYFLAFLTEAQLDRVMFPLGGLTKKDITINAEKSGLYPVSSKESQDVCFISGDYKDFLSEEKGFTGKPGPIVTTGGERIGRHNGLHSFTIGQRRGINCPSTTPFYVIRLDMENNALVVGRKNELLSRSCTVRDVHWISGAPSFPLQAVTRIRYSHKGTSSTLYPEQGNRLTVEFQEPAASVTPGQGAVFYRDDEVLGGGWIV